ncbi:Phytochrome E [Cardamine amara subsp. amara]|uniref:Phytochrome E n=1 Tax=Cardamine amara subsp. amara TaxID=228776 RepID=A0ABD1ABZ9_CARAN
MGFESSSSAASNMKPLGDSKPQKSNTAQYSVDAGLFADFDQSIYSGKSFNYSKSVISPHKHVPDEHIAAYLTNIQRGGLVQPFGCLIAVEEPSFRILGVSENCIEFLGSLSLASSSHCGELNNVKGLIGIDARTLFSLSSGASLSKAASFTEISLLNPVLVHSRMTQKPFYAVLHRIDAGIVIDLEPAKSGDPALTLAGAVQSQKLAVKAISRLQSLPGGDIGALCDTVVEDVQRLTGYDRVMVYQFHEDDHGEVVSEIRRSDLEPYLGLHYPATDIPQAARFLFKQNRVRMICDCNATPVKVVQSEELKRPLCLVNSTLRAPHSCHTQYMANMGSIASLVLAIVVKGKNSSKLWGLVVGHHCSPRYVPFPLRYACEFLMQAFGLQLQMELQLASQLAEKKAMRTQTLLCDMLLRDTVSAIVTQSPGIMDLVKCDGAALYYKGKCWLVGVTPSESQVKDLVNWLVENHGDDSTGLTTDSLVDAGYPGAISLGDAVCGVAAAGISSKDYLLWFRSNTASAIKWGGAKHHPKNKDDAGRMHPRSSFKAFLEVAKSRSLPWEISEIDAIHSLRLIMRESFTSTRPALSGNVVARDANELTSFVCEMVRVIETATAPIFGVDSFGCINGWNKKTAEITGLQASEAMGKSLANEIVQEESQAALESLMCKALQGDEEKNVILKLRKFGDNNHPDYSSDVCVLVNSCTSRDYTEKIIGVCFVGQDITSEKEITDRFIRLQGDYKTIVQSLNPLIPPIFASDEHACCSEWNAAMEKLTGWSKHEIISRDSGLSCPELKEGAQSLNELTYIRQEIKNPLNGIRFAHKLLESSEISESQRQFLQTSDACEKQITTIIEGTDLKSIEEGNLQLETEEFQLENVLDVIISQVMIMLKERNSQLRVEVAEEIKTLPLYGDREKLQLILADLLRNIVNHAPFPDSWVGIKISPGHELARDNGHYIHLQFRMIHPGKGLPSEMLSDMFDTRDGWVTPDGLGLKLSRKLLEQMNGHVSYVREDEQCFFLVDLQVKTMLGVETRGTEEQRLVQA